MRQRIKGVWKSRKFLRPENFIRQKMRVSDIQEFFRQGFSGTIFAWQCYAKTKHSDWIMQESGVYFQPIRVLYLFMTSGSSLPETLKSYLLCENS